MLGNMKVRGTSENEPRKFTKSPIKGNAAATKVFPVKKDARRRNNRFKFSPECMALSISRNFVSNASKIGTTNICIFLKHQRKTHFNFSRILFFLTYSNSEKTTYGKIYVTHMLGDYGLQKDDGIDENINPFGTTKVFRKVSRHR